MPPALEPVTPELMLDTHDNDKLRMNKVHFRAIALLLKQAGKADKSNNIAECRRCCTAILKFDITYPPKHAFWPSTATDPAEGDTTFPTGVPLSCATTTTSIVESPAPTSPSLREGAGGRAPAIPVDPAPAAISAPLACSASSSPRGRAAVARAWGTVSAANQPLKSSVECPPPPGRTSPPPDPSPTPIPTSESLSSLATQDSPPPPPPYEPTGELWPPGLD
ncbi:MAG: hypothetical protein ACREJO_17550, partial [Phycisphaerales bacterium]